MNADEQALAARIGHALGSDRVIDLGTLQSGGPLDLLQLRAQVDHLQRGAPTIECHLAVSEASWRELEAIVAELRSEGQEVSPDQLARLLLEHGVDALRESRKKTG